LAFRRIGINIAINIAMIAITTKSSINVNPFALCIPTCLPFLEEAFWTDLFRLNLMNFAPDVVYATNYNPTAPVMQPFGGKFLYLEIIKMA